MFRICSAAILILVTGLAAQTPKPIAKAKVRTTSTWTVGAGPLEQIPKECKAGSQYTATDVPPGTGFNVCWRDNFWAPLNWVAGDTGGLRVSCDVLPCKMDVAPNIWPTLNGPENVYKNANDFSGASLTAPLRLLETAPQTCNDLVGEMYLDKLTKTVKLCKEPNVWSSAGGAPPFFSYAVISSLPSSTPFVATVNPAPKVNVVTVLKVDVPYSMSVARLQWWHHTSGKAESTMALGLYDEARNLVEQTGAVSAVASTDRKGADVGPHIIPAGIYYWAWSGSDTAIRLAGYNGSGTFSVVFNPMTATNETVTWGTAANLFDPMEGLPNSLGNLTAGTGGLNVPLIVAIGGK